MRPRRQRRLLSFDVRTHWRAHLFTLITLWKCRPLTGLLLAWKDFQAIQIDFLLLFPMRDTRFLAGIKVIIIRTPFNLLTRLLIDSLF